MADSLKLVGGTKVDCEDGTCGTLGRIILESESKTVTHLAVERDGLTSASGRLVPVSYVRAVDDVIHLGCSIAEFEGFDPDEVNISAMSSMLLLPRTGVVALPATAIVHEVPDGEIEVNSEENIIATDGHAGKLLGLTIRREDSRITALLLEVGHLLHKREVTIPIETVTGIDGDRMTLSLSKAEVDGFG